MRKQQTSSDVRWSDAALPDKSAQVPRVLQIGPPSTRVAGVAGLLSEELRVAQRECKTKLVFRQECMEQNTAQAEEIAMCPANKLSVVCLEPSQCRFPDPMSSSDLAVETELVHFVGVIQDTTAYETSPLHVSRQNQTVPWRQIASVQSCVGELANTVRVQNAVPLEKGDLVITEMHSSTLNGSRKKRGNNCDTPRSVSCDRLEDQWFGAFNSVMRRRGSAGAPRPARKRRTLQYTHTQRGGVSPPQIHRAPPSRPGRPLACVHSSLLASCFISERRGAMLRPAPTAHDAVRRKSRPPLRTNSRHTEPSAGLRSLVPTHFSRVYTHTLLTPALVQSPPTCFDLQALSGSHVRR